MTYLHIHASRSMGLDAQRYRIRRKRFSDRTRRKETKFARASESIVERGVAELSKERVALFDRCTGEMAQSVCGGWARRELATADCQRTEQQQPLVIFREYPYIFGEQLERRGVLIQTFSGGLRIAGPAEQGRVCDQVMNNRSAGRYRHGQPAFLAVACQKHSAKPTQNV